MPSSTDSAAAWAKPSRKPQPGSDRAALDTFVNPATGKGTKRLNIDVPVRLHARVKAGCALEMRDMTEVVNELLEQRFPEKK